ncbi:hypothetical protein Pmani_020462 [Petrolisthes manimaculis]|uniref:Major facilitator superfamily (MFS) profile domain-containing protein n=1 Tax=Petrolisthes manimaculis TaxID=1843537 RepID=A0AAE1PGR1_9EUCA|nr:hypothetical protein Pmani_020462 [Petrolisthes manimaculis]
MSVKTIRAGDYPVTIKQIFFLLTVSSGFLLFGSMNGWTAVLPGLQKDHTHFTITEDEVAWLVSITSVVMIVFSLVAGALTEWLGPRRLLLLTLLLDAGSWLLIAFTPYKSLLYVGRVGMAVAVSFVVILVQPMIAEMSSTEIRGRASTIPEINGALGVLVAFLLATFTPWYLATALCSIIPITLLIPTFFVPESPYWLVRRGRLDEARTSLSTLMGPEGDVELELSILTRTYSNNTQTSYSTQFVELRKGRNLKPVLLVLSLFVLRELGGRSALFMYSVYIFQQAGVNLDPFVCTVLVGVSRLVFTCMSAFSLDRLGRRPVLLVTTGVCGVCQIIAGVFLYLEITGASWVPLVALLVYMGSYGLGLGPIPWVLLGEMVPTPVRSLGASIINFSNYVALFTISYAFLKIMSAVGLGITVTVLGLITSSAGVVAWLWVPETRGASLQQLERTFSSINKKDHLHTVTVHENDKKTSITLSNNTSQTSLNTTSHLASKTPSQSSLNTTSHLTSKTPSQSSLNTTSHLTSKTPSQSSLNTTSHLTSKTTSQSSLNTTSHLTLDNTSHSSLNTTSILSSKSTSQSSFTN